MINSLISEAAKFYEVNQFTKALRLLAAAEVFVEDDASLESQDLYAEVENFKGNCFLAGGNIPTAQVCFEKAIGLNPLLATAYISLGSIYLAQGLKDNALLNFNMGYELAPSEQAIVLSFAEALIEMGDVEKAAKLYQKYLSDNPNDLQIIDQLINISDLEEKKKQIVDKELIIVTGIHGSGKTTYSNSLGYPVLHIDNFFDYEKEKMKWDDLEKVISYHLFLSDENHKKIVLDGYIFYVDETLNMLYKVIAPIKKISIKFIYTDSEELYQVQRSTPERIEAMKQRQLTKEGDVRWCKKQQHFLRERIDDFLSDQKISNAEFIYRDKNEFKSSNREHLLETLGNEEFWKMNKWELMTFVGSHEGQAYQTIELDGEIIRYGDEKCWLSWENISKLNIDWKDKYVCDIGCYFAYFSLQILKSGAKKVLGIDRKELLLKVYREVLNSNNFSNFETRCIPLGNGNSLPDDNYDIIIALNMLHHVERATTPEFYNQVLESIFKNTKEALFEINDYQVNQISEVAQKFNFKLKGEVKSHRNTMYGQRYIMHFVKQ